MATRAAPRGAAPAAPDPAQDVAQLPVANPGILVIGIMAASLLQVLDTTIANVAIPHMRTALGATTETITWVLTSYIIASAVALPITGWLSDRVGARRLFIGSVAGFILASMLCGLAQNLTEMVLFRALQGVTGAFIAPLSQAFMLDTNKPSKHAQMMALWGMGIMIGPILGPVLGGWLTEQADWRWVFFVNLPIGILSLAILIANLPHREVVKRRFDIGGFVLLGVALASFQMLLDRGQTLDWFDSYEIWLWTFLFISATWMAVIHLSGAKNPLFDRALFIDRNFAIAMGFMLAIGVVMFATMALLPPMLQQLMGYDVIDTGLVLMPRGIGVLMSMQVAGMLMRRGFDARPVVATGFIVCAVSLWEMAHWSLGVDRYHIVASGLVQGLGMGLVFIPLNVSAFATLPPRLRTDGSSLLNLFRSLGASAGISLTTVMLARNLQTAHADIAANVTGASVASMVDVGTVDRYQNLGDVALRLLDLEANRQAAMVAYVDDFWMMMWITLAAVPLAFIMKRNRQPAGQMPPPGE
ncbi:DHA2 family efflux MFS transporter permease subunit [Qipengyuania sp. 6B39]|uniref:DHA2 family efflux MFS transporter permease subunit n=1 Tax=Qipengyuania proteolytica TaxID=2867239 RepID=UPI001C894E63|nr:DHA2 family efflux MFS transporter permease subunit [Qipengyuania proteolytica]MBX7496347.1 DHA2 family efflux MFS transporter permease subunit [Qipengyuania proteolytica]